MNIIFLGQFTLNTFIGPSDGKVFSHWSEYSSCSQTCGSGSKSRERTCDEVASPGSCMTHWSELIQYDSCNEGDCPGL